MNLTQHTSSTAQTTEGVWDPPPAVKAQIRNLLTFDHLPTKGDIEERAEALAKVAQEALSARIKDLEGPPRWGTSLEVLIGGAPYLMAPLEKSLRARGLMPVYAFSRRDTVEEVSPTGETIKKSVFRHIGFIR